MKRAGSDVFRYITNEGASTSIDSYMNAVSRQYKLAQQFEDTLADFDVMLMLGVAGEAPIVENPAELDVSCLVWTMVGAPTICLPLGKGTNDLPIGDQLVAPRYGDYTLLEFAESLFPETVPVIDRNTL